MTRPEIARPALVLVTDTQRLSPDGPAIEDIVRQAVAGGVSIVQLREKAMDWPALLALGTRIRDAIGIEAMLFVNGDIEAARALNADGIHLPSYGQTIRDVRRRLGNDIIVSLAVHSIDGATRAVREGADGIQIGTLFASPSHADGRTLGLDALREACAAVVPVPVIAIGGISAANAGDAIAVGAAGVAVISAILDAHDSRVAAAELRAAIDASAGAPHAATTGGA